MIDMPSANSTASGWRRNRSVIGIVAGFSASMNSDVSTGGLILAIGCPLAGRSWNGVTGGRVRSPKTQS